MCLNTKAQLIGKNKWNNFKDSIISKKGRKRQRKKDLVIIRKKTQKDGRIFFLRQVLAM
jgi:hypothetical protein